MKKYISVALLSVVLSSAVAIPQPSYARVTQEQVDVITYGVIEIVLVFIEILQDQIEAQAVAEREAQAAHTAAEAEAARSNQAEQNSSSQSSRTERNFDTSDFSVAYNGAKQDTEQHSVRSEFFDGTTWELSNDGTFSGAISVVDSEYLGDTSLVRTALEQTTTAELLTTASILVETETSYDFLNVGIIDDITLRDSSRQAEMLAYELDLNDEGQNGGVYTMYVPGARSDEGVVVSVLWGSVEWNELAAQTEYIVPPAEIDADTNRFRTKPEAKTFFYELVESLEVD